MRHVWHESCISYVNPTANACQSSGSAIKETTLEAQGRASCFPSNECMCLVSESLCKTWGFDDMSCDIDIDAESAPEVYEDEIIRLFPRNYPNASFFRSMPARCSVCDKDLVFRSASVCDIFSRWICCHGCDYTCEQCEVDVRMKCVERHICEQEAGCTREFTSLCVLSQL